MKSRLYTTWAALPLSFLVVSLSIAAAARDAVLPAGTILHCTLNEPNFSTATVEIGDPVLCHLREVTEFGRQVFPRGTYLVGHLESAKDPGHFFGKGYLKLEFDRIGVPSGDIPLNGKVIATRGYKVDREGKIDGKGHAKRDIVEWMLPPLWPWKVIMLPARGPRPKLKGETVLSLRLMDDVEMPQAAEPFGRESRLFSRPQSESLRESVHSVPQTVVRDDSLKCLQIPRGAQSFGPGWHFFGRPQNQSLRDPVPEVPEPAIRDVPPTVQTPVVTPRASHAPDVLQPTAIHVASVPFETTDNCHY